MSAYLQNALTVAGLFIGLGLAFVLFLALVTATRSALERLGIRGATR